MTIPVLPKLYGYSIHKKPTFASVVRSPRSGREVTRYQQILPLWEFDLVSEVLRDRTQNAAPDAYFSGRTEFTQWLQLFLSSAGQYGWFYYEDLSDRSRTKQGLAVGDGVAQNFLFLRTIHDLWGTLTFTEPVGGVNQDHTTKVYLNGVDTPSGGNWSISADGTTLEFVTAPANGVVIAVDFYYYYLCRFITDDLPFEEFLWNRWTVKSMKFRSIRNTVLPIPTWLPLTAPPAFP